MASNNAFDRMRMRFFKQKNNSQIKKKEDNEKEKQRVVELNASMTSKFCPLYNDNCHVDCVHFMSAKAVGKEAFYRIVGPKCRLWRI